MQEAKYLLGAVAGPLARRLTRGLGRVLMYHRFGGDADVRKMPVSVFEQQIISLKKRFHPIRLTDLAARLKNDNILPDNSFVVTVDDGYRDFCRLAVPILVRHEIPATFFVVSDFVDRKVWLWYDAIHYLVHATTRDWASLNLGESRIRFRLAGPAGRNLLWEKVADDILALPMQGKWLRIRELASELAVTLPECPTPDYEAASWEELRRLDSRLFDIGGHTKSHAILSRCDPLELRIELEESKKAIEDRLDRRVRSFCYPNGQRDDYNATCIRAVRAAGYDSAVVAHGGLVAPAADPYLITRFAPSTLPGPFRNEMNGITELRSRLAAPRW